MNYTQYIYATRMQAQMRTPLAWLLHLTALLILSMLLATTSLAQERSSLDTRLEVESRTATPATAPHTKTHATWSTTPSAPVYRAGGLVLTVNSAYDDPERGTLGDGVCDTDFTVDGEPECTLRAALMEANAQAGTAPVVIEFDIVDFGPSGSEIAPGVWQIDINTGNFDSVGPLPTISKSNVTINGLTQPGASCGDLVTGPTHDLRIIIRGTNDVSDSGIAAIGGGDNLTVRGLVVQNFASGKGIDAPGAGSLVECNYVGTDYTGETAAPNFDGINIQGTARNNVVSGNLLTGIIAGATTSGGLITRNLVGSDTDGNQPLGNGGAGIVLSPVTDWTVDTNLASANGSDGIVISNNSTGVVLTNNTVGLTKNRGVGPGGMGNGRHGIYLFGSANDNDIGLPGEGNFIGGNDDFGLLVSADGNRIRGNTVGLTLNGNTAANGVHGIEILSGSNNVIGGSAAGEGNIFAGNAFHGIQDSGSNTLIEGNVVGLNAAGAARPNGENGIQALNSFGSILRDNIVSGNAQNGIELINDTGTLVEENTVGLDAAGVARPNGAVGSGLENSGIAFESSTDLTIRGNTISGNNGSGILSQGGFNQRGGTTGAVIEENFIGTTADGSAARPNVETGLVLSGGVTGAIVTGNTLSGNTDLGLFLTDGTSGHVIEDNFIGTNASGDALGNGLSGVRCSNASAVRIGKNFSPNTIRFNAKDGIFLSGSCQDISVVGNIISDNGELAVDLAPNGPNPNDAGDGDTGANNKLNFPVVTSAENDGTNSIIAWTLSARPNTTYELLFCRTAAPDPSGFGECPNPNALTTTTTNGSGNASGTRTLGPGAYPAGSFVSMNATKVDGALPAGYRETSEFGAAVEVEDTGASGEVTIEATPTSPLTVPRGGQVSFSFTVTNATASAASGQAWFSAALGGNTVAQGVITDGTLPAGNAVTIDYVQNVPNSAPIASYDFCLRIGLFPSPFIDEACFVVTVTPARAAGGGDEWAAVDVSEWAPAPMEIASGVETEEAGAASSEALPDEVTLAGAYPNPFSGRATLSFTLPEAQRVTVAVYDVLGREVARLVDGEVEAGRHEAVLDGASLPSGVYLVRLVVGHEVRTERITLVR